MIASPLAPHTFPKSARLLCSRDFRFDKFRKFRKGALQVIYTEEGQGRFGVSISKKVIRQAVDRNRLRRLLREGFRRRREDLARVDVHFVARPGLREECAKWRQNDVDALIQSWVLSI